MGELDRLQADVNNGLLDAWVEVYSEAEEIYEALPERRKRYIEEHGHEVESLVSVIVTMKPHVRALCWSLVEQGRRASLSQPAPSIEHTVDQTVQAKSSSGVGGVDEEAERIARLEAMAEENAQLMRQILERLDRAGSSEASRAAP